MASYTQAAANLTSLRKAVHSAQAAWRKAQSTESKWAAVSAYDKLASAYWAMAGSWDANQTEIRKCKASYAQWTQKAQDLSSIRTVAEQLEDQAIEAEMTAYLQSPTAEAISKANAASELAALEAAADAALAADLVVESLSETECLYCDFPRSYNCSGCGHMAPDPEDALTPQLTTVYRVHSINPTGSDPVISEHQSREAAIESMYLLAGSHHSYVAQWLLTQYAEDSDSVAQVIGIVASK